MEGVIVRRVLSSASDRNCLFRAVGYLVGHFVEANSMRQLMALHVLSDQEKYSEAFLGMPNPQYLDRLENPYHWGGATELSILANYYACEIAAYDIRTKQCHLYGQENNYSERIMLIYDGRHYDPLVLSPAAGWGPDETIFPIDNNRNIGSAEELVISFVEEQQSEIDQTGNRGPFASLPSDITTSILAMLPLESIAIARCVNKIWNGKISHPTFPKTHFDGASIGLFVRLIRSDLVSRTLSFIEDYFEIGRTDIAKIQARFKIPFAISDDSVPDFEDLGTDLAFGTVEPREVRYKLSNSCNGLICLYMEHCTDPISVCNPVTGEFITLPTTNQINFSNTVAVGLGFHSITNEYKVVRIWHKSVDPVIGGGGGGGGDGDDDDGGGGGGDGDDDDGDGDDAFFNEGFECFAQVHTLGTEDWRDVGIDTFTVQLGYPTHLIGSIHFVARYLKDTKSSIIIIRFNLETERFESFPSPPDVFDIGNDDLLKSNITIGDLGGSIYLCQALDEIVTGWIMGSYGRGDSWTQLFRFDKILPKSRPWCLYWSSKHYKQGGAFVLYNANRSLFYHEPGNNGFKRVRISTNWKRAPDWKLERIEVIPHVPSMIPMREILQRDNINVNNVHSRCAKISLSEDWQAFSMRTGEQYGEYAYSSPPSSP